MGVSSQLWSIWIKDISLVFPGFFAQSSAMDARVTFFSGSLIVVRRVVSLSDVDSEGTYRISFSNGSNLFVEDVQKFAPVVFRTIA